jgi:hypothetical protein
MIHCDIYIYAYILAGFTPPSLSQFLPPPILRRISTGFIFLFSYMDTKHMLHIHPHSLFPSANPVPLVPTPEDLFFPPALHFLN